MKNKSNHLLILLTIIIISFPSICFSKSVTVQGEYCDVYLGDLKNRIEFDEFGNTVRKKSIENGIRKIDKNYDFYFTDKCMADITSKYLEKLVIVSHTEKDRKICDKVKITLNTEVMNKYLIQNSCKMDVFDFLEIYSWSKEIDNILTKKSEKINIGLIIETKISDLRGNKGEQLENEQEQDFFDMINKNKDKYNLIDRKHLSKVLDEQKLSSAGITDVETVKLGKLLNLDIIVLRLIYENSQVTKVLKVDTGEVLLFKTYETKKEEGWVLYDKSEVGDFSYDKDSITRVSSKVFKVWWKWTYSKSYKDRDKDYIQFVNDKKLSTGDYNKREFQVVFDEIDCLNNTSKTIQSVIYNNEGESLLIHDYPNPEIRQIIPGTIGGKLLRIVCQ